VGAIEHGIEATVAASGAGLGSLLFAFVAGGLFFSTALAAAGAVYAFGVGNVRSGLALFGLVARRVLRISGAVLKASQVALVGPGIRDRRGWRFREAWLVLRSGFEDARRVAAEGVEALRAETRLYAAAVGAPGLVTVQYALDRLMPLSLGKALEAALAEALDTAPLGSGSVRKIKLRHFSAGSKAPKLEAARAYDLGPGCMAFDVDVQWASELKADLEMTTKAVGARVPVSVRNFHFAGTVRVVLVPLVPEPPGFGAILLSLPSAPELGMDVRVAGGEVTKLPWLKGELEKAIKKAVAEELRWPKRVVIPAAEQPSSKTRPAGDRLPFLLSQAELAALAMDDPLLRAERALLQQMPALSEGPRGAAASDPGDVFDLSILVADADLGSPVGSSAEGPGGGEPARGTAGQLLRRAKAAFAEARRVLMPLRRLALGLPVRPSAP